MSAGHVGIAYRAARLFDGATMLDGPVAASSRLPFSIESTPASSALPIGSLKGMGVRGDEPTGPMGHVDRGPHGPACGPLTLT